ncbi:MAG: type II toxin-antitoxin system RatA family toxin [Arenicellales bacterium]
MYKVERSALVMHSAAQMYELVNDVDRYQEFLPWCGGSRVLDQDQYAYTASVDIAFKGVSKTFTTRNRVIPDQRTDLTLIDGPFSDLSGFWAFKEISPEASRISLELNFGFSSKVVEAVLGPVFRIIADSMVDSFRKRADQVYSKQGA